MQFLSGLYDYLKDQGRSRIQKLSRRDQFYFIRTLFTVCAHMCMWWGVVQWMPVLVCEWADKESVHTNYAWICTILAKCIVLRRERKWRLDLLRSSIQCIRGARSACGHTFKQSPLPTDLVVAESNISLWTFTNFVKPFLFSCIHFLAFYITRYFYHLPAMGNTVSME